MRYWDRREGKTLQIFDTNRYLGNGLAGSRLTAALIVPCVLFTACEGPAATVATIPAAGDSVPDAASTPACGPDGQLAVELYGSISTALEWKADVLSCTGMRRPDGEGVRLRVSGPLEAGDDAKTLAFILGIPDLDVGQTGTELPTNVTLIEEGTGRFFGTRDTSGCWTDFTSRKPTADHDDQTYRIEAILYCVSPLAELNGNTSVTFTELKFAGRLAWEQPE
jgi:hypothetical protein